MSRCAAPSPRRRPADTGVRLRTDATTWVGLKAVLTAASVRSRLPNPLRGSSEPLKAYRKMAIRVSQADRQPGVSGSPRPPTSDLRIDDDLVPCRVLHAGFVFRPHCTVIGDMLVGMVQPRGSRKAGEGAARKYEELTQAWLRRNRGRFLILAAVFAPLVIGANLAAARWSSLRWSAGLVTGMVVAMFVIARMSPPPWIENWQDGAIGEQWTGRALRELESQGWRIFHDLTASHGNMDLSLIHI